VEITPLEIENLTCALTASELSTSAEAIAARDVTVASKSVILAVEKQTE
jgi:hypothetical protein